MADDSKKSRRAGFRGKKGPQAEGTGAEDQDTGGESVPASKYDDRGGALSLTPGQMRQVAFIHGITSQRCQCGDVESCRDCNTTATMKQLAGRHLGYF